MQYLINFLTRTTMDSLSSIIDAILTNIQKPELSITGIVTALSDRNAQLLEVYFSVEKYNQPYTQFKRKFNKENNNLFLKQISNETFMV